MRRRFFSGPFATVATLLGTVAVAVSAGGALANSVSISGPAAAVSPAIRQNPYIYGLVFPVEPEPMCYMGNLFGGYSKALGGWGKHQGVDISATIGQEVYAVEDGVLTREYTNTGSAGLGWELEGDSGYAWRFYHLDQMDEELSVGDRVYRGQYLGTVGETGNAGGPHLHFERREVTGYNYVGLPRSTPEDPLPHFEIPSGCTVAGQ